MKLSIQEAKFHEKYEKELQEIREKVFRNYENVTSTSDKLDNVLDRMNRISDKAEVEIRRLVARELKSPQENLESDHSIKTTTKS